MNFLLRSVAGSSATLDFTARLWLRIAAVVWCGWLATLGWLALHP